VLTKGEVVLEGRSSDLLGSDELLESYLGGGHGEAGATSEPAGAATAGGARKRRSRQTD
jgi:nanoRNase/pAp phosphatase (c-di-AMP/oligoRNAs hydrolase)